MVYYNPLDKNCKSVIGAVKSNELIRFEIYAKEKNECKLEIQSDKTGNTDVYIMNKNREGFWLELGIKEIGLYYYWFILDGVYFARGEKRLCTSEIISGNYQLTVVSADFQTPQWFKGGIMYQIFPDRFFRSGNLPEKRSNRVIHENWFDIPEYRPNADGKIVNNDFFCGNLKGITEKLDYLKTLKINCIYLNPIFESASNHRYDTGDYKKIDCYLGDEDDLKELITECEKREIRLVLDGVFNHTGDDSIYFNKYGNYPQVGAYQSKDSEYYKWYNFLEYPEKYECWWGIKTLPQINETEKSYIDFICGEDGILAKYLRLGIYGFRLDVADELPSSFIKKIRERIKKENPNAVLIGEVWEDASNKIAYGERREYLQGFELDSVMNYPLKNAIINFIQSENTFDLLETLRAQQDNYPRAVLDSLMNFLGTHDTMRIINVFGLVEYPVTKAEKSIYELNEKEKNCAITRLKIASLLLYTVYGTPSVYYGDEVGLEGFEDPFSRKTYPWGSENTELLDWFRLLGEARNSDAFKDGELIIRYENKNCMCYERRGETTSVFIAVNYGRIPLKLSFTKEVYSVFEKTFAKEYEVGCGDAKFLLGERL